MSKWEYLVEEMDNGDEESQDLLNKLGDEGWELISVTPAVYDDGRCEFEKAFLKRKKSV